MVGDQSHSWPVASSGQFSGSSSLCPSQSPGARAGSCHPGKGQRGHLLGRLCLLVEARDVSSGSTVIPCPQSWAESYTWPEEGCQASAGWTKELQISWGLPGAAPLQVLHPSPCRRHLPVAVPPPCGPWGSQSSCRNARPLVFRDQCPGPAVPWWQLWLGPGPWGAWG